MAFPYGHEKTRHHLANGCVRSTQHEADWLHSFPTSNDDLLQRVWVNVFVLCPWEKKYGRLIIKEKKNAYPFPLVTFVLSDGFVLCSLTICCESCQSLPAMLYISLHPGRNKLLMKGHMCKKKKKKEKTLDQESPTWCLWAPSSPQGPHE